MEAAGTAVEELPRVQDANLVAGVKPGQARDPATGRLLPKGKKPLGTILGPELAAMEWVVSHSVDETNQHVYYRRLWAEEPKYFAELLRSEREKVAVRPPEIGSPELPAWDGVGACPCCKRAAEVVEGPEAVELMIQELLAEVDDEQAD